MARQDALDPAQELEQAEHAIDAAGTHAAILEGFGLDPTEARTAATAAGEQMRHALDRLAAGG